MKKHLMLASFVLAGASSSAAAFHFHDVFAEADEMMRRTRAEMARFEKQMASAQRSSENVQADYTVQNSQDGDVYSVTIKLNGAYGKRAPKVMINSSKDNFDREVKELEVDAVSDEQVDDAAVKKHSYSSYSYSSSVVVKDGVVSKQGQENSRATVEDGALKIIHQLPKNVDEKSYTMSFKDGLLDIKFDVMAEQPKAEKRVLEYTASEK